MGPWQQEEIRMAADQLGAYLVRNGVIDAGRWQSRIWLTGLHEVLRHMFVPARVRVRN